MGGKVIWNEVRGGGSYASSGDYRLHLGLGPATVVPELELRWPSGQKQTLHNVKTDQILHVNEP